MRTSGRYRNPDIGFGKAETRLTSPPFLELNRKHALSGQCPEMAKKAIPVRGTPTPLACRPARGKILKSSLPPLPTSCTLSTSVVDSPV